MLCNTYWINSHQFINTILRSRAVSNCQHDMTSYSTVRTTYIFMADKNLGNKFVIQAEVEMEIILALRHTTMQVK